MRFLIAGAGAIGGYIGALMTRAGQDVTLYARGAHLRAMQERGLRILSADGDFEVRPTGNAVSLEDEMLKVASNAMDFQAATALYTRGLGLIKTALGKR